MWPAMIIGAAWFIRRARRRTGPKPRRRKLRIWWSLFWSGRCRLRRRWWPLTWRLLWRSFRCPPGPGSWPPAAWWPSRPANGAGFRHWLPRSRDGRSSPDPAGLHPIGHDHALSGYRRAVARAGHGAGDRRGLCRTFSGMRPRPGISVDASGRSGVVLVVSLALAGTAGSVHIRRPLLGHQMGWLASWQRSSSPVGWPCSHCASSRTPSDSPLPCAGRPSAVSRSAVPPPG